MQACQEVTRWKVPTPNHIYLLDGNKMHAYIPVGRAPVYFKKPMTIELRGRKFENLKDNPFADVQEDVTVIKVTGSRGQIYTVNTVEKTCSCMGFSFRGKCRHLSEILG